MAQDENTFDAANSGQQGGGSTGGANSSMSGGYGGNSDAHTGLTGPGAQGGVTGGTSASDRMDQVKDKAADAASQVKEKAAQAGTQVREKATQLKGTLADKLEQGADKLRQRTNAAGNAMDDATDSDTGAAAKRTLDRASESLAGGMQKSADWMRTTDMDQMRTSIEAQVRQNPGRSLLVALGIGYVLGKVLRGSRES